MRLALSALVAVVACNLKPDAPPVFNVDIQVSSDPGHPLAGAVVIKGGREGPRSEADGRIHVKLSGREGESVDLMVRCPDGYVSPTMPISALLRRNAGGTPAVYEATCPPSVRTLVAAIVAENGPFLPITMLGQPIGRTDANGVFTMATQLHPGDELTLVIDTSSEERIRPQNPVVRVIMKPYDDVVTLTQKLTWLPRHVRAVLPCCRPVLVGGHVKQPPCRWCG